MVSQELISALYEHGLGELFILHAGKTYPLIGQVVSDKGRLILKDRGMLRGVSGAQVGPCWDIGIVGAVCYQEGHEWESLTFVGPDHCILQQDLSSTRVGLMQAARNEFNERLIDFVGSVYRGFQLMLDNYFLPVVLLNEVKLNDGGRGLAVSNLRMAGIPFDVMGELHERLHALMAPHQAFDVQDVTLNEDEFAALFAGYKDQRR